MRITIQIENNLKHVRKDVYGLTLKDIADAINISPVAVKRMEERELDKVTLFRYARLLVNMGADLDDIFTLTDSHGRRKNNNKSSGSAAAAPPKNAAKFKRITKKLQRGSAQ